MPREIFGRRRDLAERRTPVDASARTTARSERARGASKAKLRRRYWISDGVYGAFNAIVYDGWLPHAVVVPDPFGDDAEADDRAAADAETPPGDHLTTVFGPTCDSLDVVFSRVERAPRMRRDDWLLFPCCGAYTSAGACDFNGIPATRHAGVATRYVRSADARCTAEDARLRVLYSDRPPMEILRYCD